MSTRCTPTATPALPSMTMRHAALGTLLAAALLSGCATQAPQPGTPVAATRFDQLVVPGRTTRADLLAAFGPTKTVVFDSGMETWLYTTPAPGGRGTELVLLVGRDGIVHKMRKRPPYPTDPAP